MTDATPTLKLENLDVEYRVRGRSRKVLDDINLEIGRGECYGLVGESGCGKSTAAYTVLRYLPRNGSVPRGRVLINGEDLLGFDGEKLRELRRKSVAMVYQDPGKALNPSIRIGHQVAEVFELLGVPKAEWQKRTVDILKKVRISDPASVMERYPHQLSGGMQQRVAIAMALASEPSLLVLDEPTTGLDATVEADVLDLIVQLRHEFDTSILFISHNLGVIAKMCDRVGVLYAGRLVEQGRTSEIFRNPRHPYTVGLLRCLPQRGRSKDVAPLTTIPGFLPTAGSDIKGCVFADRCPLADEHCRKVDPPPYHVGEGHFSRCHYHERAASLNFDTEAVSTSGSESTKKILELIDVSKTFGRGGSTFRALNDVSFDVMEGETLGIVGESGSGKTTLARSVLGIVPADEGSTIRLDGKQVAPLLKSRAQSEVKSLQIVFQNPDSALNRSHTVRRMIGRTISLLTGLASTAKASRILELTRAVRLADRYLDMRPRQLSGGLKQRVAIARSFSGDPRVVVLDEPTSALDVSVQAAILNLLVELQKDKQVSYIFISHDLGVVRYLSDRIAVLYLGRLMEIGKADAVFSGPHHPYTEALLSSVPSVDGTHRERVKLNGEIPSAMNPPSGCVFHTRCVRKIGKICEEQQPPLHDTGDGHLVRCHIPATELPRAPVEKEVIVN
ncbi:ABC transporter ATP-binding protein [Rhizobium sp. LjRoot254]|uniref:ABC transporter ATP-binding protein n=1 Tax=Rhizobium sp. LjRoot254 TaxID=3342297 RepID=UPI003ED0CEFB